MFVSDIPAKMDNCAEKLLVMNVMIQKLLDEQRWEDVTQLSEKALMLAEAIDMADEAAQAQAAKLCMLLSSLGMVLDERSLRRVLLRVIQSSCGVESMGHAIKAFRAVARGNMQTFWSMLQEELLSLSFFDALMAELDLRTAPSVSRHPRLSAAVIHHLKSSDPLTRARALTLVGK